jgi:phosphoribosylanthranilate isomerase
VRVKICGVTRPVDAEVAEEAGASCIGTILVAGSARCISQESAAEIGRATSLPLAIVVAGETASHVASMAERAGAAVIQLHGDESEGLVQELRAAGRWELWKAVRVRNGTDLAAAADRFAPLVDLLLLDAWHPTELGGTGRRFPWEVLERAELPSDLRIGVAGGLTAENVAEAITRLHPNLVDVSTSVEASPGIKDPDRVRAFVRNALQAFSREVSGSYRGNQYQSGRGE